ncbi:hypothetical protein CJ030_MR3G009898 [Morella rubra]|uniref:Uncharacterized protein n=1 Tax=Morella rubra TaxID=262757 RepID=A0A6A1W9R5_9ROSI|nr:hypothetical protein CJ030_MR3G009898 [Morella rubra]
MGVRVKEEPLLVSDPGQDEEQQQKQEQHSEANLGSVVRETWSESKKMWAIASPSILSGLAMFNMTVRPQSFSGHLSDLDLAAISIASTVIIAITFGFLSGYFFHAWDGVLWGRKMDNCYEFWRSYVSSGNILLIGGYFGFASQASSSLLQACEPSSNRDEEYADVDWDKLGFALMPN